MSATVPFLWAEKATIRHIRERVPKLKVAGALAAYLGLCEIASDKAVEEFDADLPKVAEKSGFGLRIIGQRIADLEAAGVVEVTRPKVRGPARFKLLNALGTECRTIRSDCRTISTGCMQPLPNVRHSDAQLLPNPIVKEKKGDQPTNPRPLKPTDRIGLEKQSEALELDIRRLSPLRLHEQAPGHKERLELKRRQLENVKSRLAEAMEAIT